MAIFKNIKESWSRVPRTLRHYIAFLKTEKHYLGCYKYKYHDLDKLFMYIFTPWKGVSRIKKIHEKRNKHHLDSKLFYNVNYEEAAIDWECCRFTKPDEPMSAREFLESQKGILWDPHYYNMDKQLRKLGL